VVVLGGGTGISATLRGLTEDGAELTAIVTVADDGGSSGRLRKDYAMLPPGDIRNCLVAMADGDALLRDLFSYRFEDSILKGHSFGNLFLAVLTRLTGDFHTAVERARGLLGVSGRVIPSTTERVVLVAHHEDGTRSTGEQCISRGAKAVVGMELKPEPPKASDEILGAIAAADMIVVGPGSLFTSLIPNLLVPGIVEALDASSAPIVLVANLVTQPGETDGFKLSDHLRALRDVGRLSRVDHVILNASEVPADVVARYEESGSALVDVDGLDVFEGASPTYVEAVTFSDSGVLRHDAGALGACLSELAAAHGSGHGV